MKTYKTYEAYILRTTVELLGEGYVKNLGSNRRLETQNISQKPVKSGFRLI